MTSNGPEQTALLGLTVVAVTPLLWAVYSADQAADDTAVGHIDCDGDRFHVGLDGDEMEAYSFATLRESTQWFAEYLAAVTLGTHLESTIA
jgi:hypothetical protein